MKTEACDASHWEKAMAQPEPSRRRLRIIGWLLLIGLALGLEAQTNLNAAPASRTAVILQVAGPIGPATADYLSRGLVAAAERQAALVVLRLDTPGGLDTSMRDIIRDILASPVPVVTYVSPSGARAASAGTYIMYASHVAAMAPGTNLGAATPVAIGGLPLPGGSDDRGGGDEPTDQTGDETENGRPPPRDSMESKVVNDAVAYIRSLAEFRGRNADWAEQAVREGASLSASAALEQDVIDIVARSMDDLLSQAHGRVVAVGDTNVTLDTTVLELEHIDPDWRNDFLAAITNPNVALILMMIGIYGLIFEFMNPGALYPGIIGTICLLVGLYALAALPVNYAGLALIVLGIALMVAEAFTPSLGALGIGGAIAFVLGATILIETDVPAFEIAWPVILGTAAVSLALTLVVVRLAISSHRRKVVSGREEMIGARGEVMDWSARGSGHIFVHSERWKAVSKAPLAPGQDVRVVSVEDLTLTVEPVEEKTT
jgi:membrane-bound serine protease (ClpP class)